MTSKPLSVKQWPTLAPIKSLGYQSRGDDSEKRLACVKRLITWGINDNESLMMEFRAEGVTFRRSREYLAQLRKYARYRMEVDG